MSLYHGLITLVIYLPFRMCSAIISSLLKGDGLVEFFGSVALGDLIYRIRHSLLLSFCFTKPNLFDVQTLIVIYKK